MKASFEIFNINFEEAHGSVEVEALCYKPEGRWFEIR
jgi:hypothetical protein